MSRGPFRNLGSYLDFLKTEGQLQVVKAPVDPDLELAEVHRRVIAAGGPALLFENVKGKSFPVATNLFGTKWRVDAAFGDEAKDLVRQVARLPEELLPPSMRKVWGLRGLGKRLLRVGMRHTTRAPVLECTLPGADLTALPAIKSWEKDGGPFITLPLVHTPGWGGKPENLGMYRIHIHDRHETGLHFQIGKGGGYHFQEAEKAGQPLPVNIYIGGPPGLILGAIAPLPENVPELLLTSLVQGSRLARGRSKSCVIPPVAEAEFCLTGFAPPGVRRPEGPFGDHYGYYSLEHPYPVFRPTTIFHRKNAVYPATVVGKPRQEDFFIGDYLQELLLPMIPLVMPGVRDLWSYGETGYHSLAAAVLKERYGKESMASAFRILGEGQLALTKFLIGIDRPMDLRDFRAVLTHVLERVDWRTDLFIFSELAMDTLDYTGPEVNKGSKGVILGLGEKKRSLGGVLPQVSSDLVRRAEMFVPGCLVVEGATYNSDKELCTKIAAQMDDDARWPLVIVVDDVKKALRSEAAFLWTTFTRFEPGADIYARRTEVRRQHLCHHGPIVIDARMKPWYPEELFCDAKTAARVSERWKEYFPDGNVTMGDSDLAHL